VGTGGEMPNVKAQMPKGKIQMTNDGVRNTSTGTITKYTDTNTFHGYGQRARTRNTNSERRDNGLLSRKTGSIIKSKGYGNPANKNQETPEKFIGLSVEPSPIADWRLHFTVFWWHPTGSKDSLCPLRPLVFNHVVGFSPRHVVFPTSTYRAQQRPRPRS
jgi:hypothetical protein